MIAPYRHALFEALASRADLLVAYATERSKDRQWAVTTDGSYERFILPNSTYYAFGRPFTLAGKLADSVKAFRPDVIVATLTRSNAIDVLRLMAIARAIGCRFVPWVGDVDKSLLPATVPPLIMGVLDRMLLFALRRADACISYSKLTDAWLDRRVPRLPRVTGTQVLDPTGKPPRLRATGQGRAIEMLFVGKHEPRKGLRELANAMHLLSAEKIQGLSFSTAGDGPLLQELGRRLPRGVRLRPRGQMSSDDLANLYRDVDFLVLPSLEDPWGFVTNEAMALGTPVACSSRCGSVELAERAGWSFDVADPGEIARALSAAIDGCRASDRRQRAVAAEAEYRPGPAAVKILDFFESRFA